MDRLLRPSPRLRAAILGGLIAAYGGLVVGIAPVLRSGGSSLDARQVEASLPVSLPMWAGRSLIRDELLTRLNLEVSLQYRRDFDRIVTPPPLDDTVRLPPATGGTTAHPDVLLIVVESLRAQAFEQGWMPRLAAWAAGGMRFDRHYANSNSSQAGLFALLYGRHLAGEAADQVLLSKPDQPPRMVFVRDATRADIRIALDGPDIAIVGFADDQDRPTPVPSGLIGSGWVDAFGAQLKLLAR